MKIEVGEGLLREIRAHGEATYPYECCGFMLGQLSESGKEVHALKRADNDATEPKERRFLITPKAYMQAEKAARAQSMDIVGFYHSHPDHPAQPSQYDLDHAWPVLSYVIVSVQQGESADLTSWILNSDRSAFDAETVDVT